jgi:long-chain acyl-CoA synthetase
MIRLTEKTLGCLCLAAAAKYGERTAFTIFENGKINEGRQITYRMMGLRVRQIGLLLRQLGVAEGARVLLISENCPEWPLAYFGIALAGAVSVPLLTSFSPEQVRHIAAHCEASAIIFSRAMAGKIGQIADIPLIFLDTLDGEITVMRKGSEERLPLPVLGGEENEFPQRGQDDLATIIYTSGTLGNSKGVMLSGLNLISCTLSSLIIKKVRQRDRLLSVLPLAHAYECSLGMIVPVLSGASVCYLDRPLSLSVLGLAAQALRPTMMVSVPVFIEKMYRGAILPKLQQSRLYRFSLTKALAERIAGCKLVSVLGGSIRFFGIGGAPLSSEVEKFLRRARFPFAPGYGLTEAAPLVSGTVPKRFPFRSTGKVSPGMEVRIDIANVTATNGAKTSVGEIQVRGPNVMMGYYRSEEQTREVFTVDGWLRTGDLGRVDRKGKLYICGRLKALILGPCGENIYPEEIEGLLGTSQLIEEALVLPGEKGELVALVRLSDAAIPPRKAAASAVEHTLEELRSWANKKLAGFSRLSRIEVRNEPFEKTPTMKIKRHLYIQSPLSGVSLNSPLSGSPLSGSPLGGEA